MSIILECDQGSEEWHNHRAGVITASMFSTVRKKVSCLTEQQASYVAAIKSGSSQKDAAAIAGYKAIPKAEGIVKALDGQRVGDWSDAAKDYAFRLAIERISGKPLDEGFETWSMKRGHELEPDARREHEAITGLFVERAGFVVTEDRLFGASADGLIEADGGSEYKCFVDPAKLRAFWIDNDASSVMEQAMGCMWLTGRKWWHICVYCPALESVGKKLWWKEFKRDDDFIEEMEADLLEFSEVVLGYEKLLRPKESA